MQQARQVKNSHEFKKLLRERFPDAPKGEWPQLELFPEPRKPMARSKQPDARDGKQRSAK